MGPRPWGLFWEESEMRRWLFSFVIATVMLATIALTAQADFPSCC